MGVIDEIKGFFAARSGVDRVADDPDLQSELLLLVRMMFADGELHGEERASFEALLHRAFGIEPADVPEVMKFLATFGYETTPAQAAQTFEGVPRERREALLRHMAEMARADARLHPKEIELMLRTGALLGFESDDVAALLDEAAPTKS